MFIPRTWKPRCASNREYKIALSFPSNGMATRSHVPCCLQTIRGMVISARSSTLLTLPLPNTNVCGNGLHGPSLIFPGRRPANHDWSRLRLERYKFWASNKITPEKAWHRAQELYQRAQSPVL